MQHSLCCKLCGKAYTPPCTQQPDLCGQDKELDEYTKETSLEIEE